MKIAKEATFILDNKYKIASAPLYVSHPIFNYLRVFDKRFKFHIILNISNYVLIILR